MTRIPVTRTGKGHTAVASVPRHIEVTATVMVALHQPPKVTVARRGLRAVAGRLAACFI